MKYIVADNSVIVNTQGLRYVQKLNGDITYRGGGLYSLVLHYKGSHLNHTYSNEQDRNAMFDQISKKLTGDKQ